MILLFNWVNFRFHFDFPGCKAKLRKARRISSPGVMFVEHLNFSLLATKTCMQRTKDHKLIGELDGLHENLPLA